MPDQFALLAIAVGCPTLAVTALWYVFHKTRARGVHRPGGPRDKRTETPQDPWS